MLDLEQLLNPLSEEAPAGENPEGEDNPELYGKLLELQTASEGKPEQEYGDNIIPAEPPNWKEVKRDALALFERTKSLTVAVILTRAEAHLDHVPGLADGLELIAGLLENYWPTVYPLLDEEDENDPTDRLMALEQFNSKEALRDVRACQLVSSSRLGSYSVRDYLLAKGSSSLSASPDEVPPELSEISAAMLDSDLDDLQNTHQALERCNQAIDRIQNVIATQAPSEPFNLQELKSSIAEIAPFVADSMERRGQVAGGEGGEGIEGGAAAGDNRPGPARAGEINSREDAIRMLDRISEYFNRHEPSSPVPLLLQRAKRLVAQDFLAILNDIAPDAMQQVRNISGLDSSDSD